jgi:hypothetical protein
MDPRACEGRNAAMREFYDEAREALKSSTRLLPR